MIPRFCIERPVATTLLAIGVILAGLSAYKQLPVAALPQVDFPTISVSASLTGASPQTMATAVATPLIKHFETIPGVTEISARSALGTTSIVLQFNLNRDIDAAAADVQAAISQTTRQLPDNMTTPPSYRKSNPASAPIMLLAVKSDTLSRTKVDELAENVLSPALSTLPGVAEVTVYGAQTYAVRVEVDPSKLKARGLPVDSVTTAIASANSQTPVGSVQNAQQRITLSADTQRTNAEEFRTLVIASGNNGAPVHLGDVARVEDGVDNPDSGGFYDGKQAILLAVLRQPDANTVAVIDGIKARLPELQVQLPASVSVDVMNDSSKSINAAIEDVEFALGLTIALVILVIYLFTGYFAATVIPGLAVPLSLIATFAGMYWLGYSLDNISLLGLTLSVGLVVDDAIVMLENIIRYTEQGMGVREAAIRGSAEVSGTIISMSVSLVAVFIPILLMGGVVGRLFSEFSVVVTMAILASAVVSLTVTPMLGARLPPHQGKPLLIARIFDRGFKSVLGRYDRAVGWCLRHRITVLGVFFASVTASYFLFITLPTGFFPTEDIGQLSISTTARADISYAAMRDIQGKAAAIVLSNPAVNHVMSVVGSNRNGLNGGSMFVELKDRSERPPLDQTLGELRGQLSKVTGLRSFVTPQQSLRFGGRSSASQYQLVVQSLDSAKTNEWSNKIMEAMNQNSHFTDVATDADNAALEANIVVDKDRAAAYGISDTELRKTLNVSFGGYTAGQIQSTGDSYNVIVEFDASRAWDDEMMRDINVLSSRGTLVPLSNFAHIERRNGPVSINQTGQLVATTISFNLPANEPLGTATSAVDQIKKDLKVPADVFTAYGGSAKVFQDSQSNTPLLIVAAVMTIYVVLGVLYESFIHPLTILSGLPAAALGALLALKVGGFDLTLIALIGLLMLIGIVKKNAIMMIDVALETLRSGGSSPAEAIHEACVRRFRPIMMTTFCALLGALPIAIGGGASSELRQPLGVAVVGGLVVSQLLTLFITPVIFVEMEKLSRFLGRVLSRRAKHSTPSDPHQSDYSGDEQQPLAAE